MICFFPHMRKAALGGAAAVLALVGPTPAGAFESDDFSRANLDPDRWTFVNPLGDGRLAMSNEGSESRLTLSVPAGLSHDPWPAENRAVRVTRAVLDEDLSFVVKFDSEPILPFQMQGLFVESDDENRIRFDTHHDGSSLRVFGAVTVNGISSSRFNGFAASGTARFMRVDRVGDDWTFLVSGDGQNWSEVGTYSHAFIASRTSVFVANHAYDGPSPAYTAVIDCVFDASEPILDEDGATDLDVWAPFIHTVTPDANGSDLVVSWFTDEPAIGRVEFGESEGYGSVEGEVDERYEHSIALRDLSPGILHYRIGTEDLNGRESVTANFQHTVISEAPVFDVWYGEVQPFGHIGRPQTWVNVLGNISDPDGVVSLEARLNDDVPVDLTIGPDGNRLVSDGDFNFDIATGNLLPGPNEVTLTATDAVGNMSETSVTVDYQDGPVWPTTYSVNWGDLASPAEIQTVAHVVDGFWTLDGGNLRTEIEGYDRLVAIGDVTWSDYEVRVPVTIHSSTPWLGVGILLRWSGHTDNPIFCSQPKCGWLPLGTICWYRLDRLEIYGNHQEILGTQSRTLAYDVPYWFKARVETNAGGGLYQFKVWEVGLPEPSEWDVTGQEELTDPQAGSMMLLTHRADVSFGSVAIVDLATTGTEPHHTAPRITLAEAIPNPFTRSTDIAFTIDRSASVSIRIFDVSGRLVRTLADAETPAGSHRVRWDGRSTSGRPTAPGVYYYTLRSGRRVDTHRIVRSER